MDACSLSKMKTIKKIDAEIAEQQDSARKSIQQETKKKQAE